MKKIKLFLFETTLSKAKELSPIVFHAFQNNHIEFEIVRWDGMTTSLPPQETVAVVASPRMLSSREDVGKHCANHNHFVFEDDCVIDALGLPSRYLVAESVKSFADSLKKKKKKEEDFCLHPPAMRVRTHRGFHCSACGKRF